MALTDIDTFVIAILENRSFDHMLGYLSLPDANGPQGLEGLQKDPNWRAAVANPRAGHAPYPPMPVNAAEPIVDDPPHDRESIALQISSAAAARPSMGGFVESYLRFSKEPPADPASVMLTMIKSQSRLLISSPAITAFAITGSPLCPLGRRQIV